MRATSMVAWPLQSLARISSPSRGGAGTLYAGFHVLIGHSTCLRQQSRWSDNHQRQYDGLRDAHAGPRRLVVRCLNRIMLEPSEVCDGEEGKLSATLPAVDSRAAHVRAVLKLEDGESVRVGVVNAGRIDDASINWVDPLDPPEGKPPADIPGRRTDRKSSPEWKDLVLDLGPSDSDLLQPVPQERRPKVALMLAVPRPLQLERILPVVASLGVTTIVLCQAKKVPKFYFGSHFFRDPPSTRAKLIEGLSQCGDTVLPEVVVARRLKVFLEDDIDRLFPRDRWVRALAHPTRLPARSSDMRQGAPQTQSSDVDAGTGEDAGQVESDISEPTPVAGVRFSQIEPPEGCDPADAGVLVAVGPEGGWVEPDELEFLQSFGFQAVTLGDRVLRSDVAVNSLLALAHAWVDERAIGGTCSPSSLQMAASSAP
ncbi:unnamed protein product [Scytosiphon promiscuus]